MMNDNNNHQHCQSYYYYYLVSVKWTKYYWIVLLLLCYNNILQNEGHNTIYFCNAFQLYSARRILTSGLVNQNQNQQQQQQQQQQRTPKYDAFKYYYKNKLGCINVLFWGSSFSSSSSTCKGTSSSLFQSSSSQQQQQQEQQQQQSMTPISTTSSSLPPVIQIDKVTCSYDGGRTYQLQETSYIVQRTSKVALVGRNGAGKSTLLRIIAQAVFSGSSSSSSSVSSSDNTISNYFDISYTGTVSCARDVRIAFVEQEPPMPSDITVADSLLGITTTTTSSNSIQQQKPRSVYDAVRRYRSAVENAENDPETFTNASSDMDQMNGWSVLAKCDEIATKLRVYQLQQQQLSSLSGGERKRVALAAALIQEPDVLLLDEPTNYLSLAGVQWLTNILKNSKLTILMVTHDRAFLNDVCDRVVELDVGKLYEYISRGTVSIFNDYIQGKEERLALEVAAIQSAKAKLRVEADWMSRQPQARQTKSKSRIDAFYELEKTTKPKNRIDTTSFQLDDTTTTNKGRRIGGKILSLRNVNLQFTNSTTGSSKVMVKDFSYDFCKGDRICLAGANGVGKTTFLRVLAGEIQPDSGSVDTGDTIVLGMYDQLGIKIDTTNCDQTALQYVCELCSSLNDGAGGGIDQARQLLRQFAFPKERWNERIVTLSGGERRRLQMLSVLSTRPNFLIMDEPSVDLDIITLQALESFLCNDYTGVLLIVSHDRYFADKVADHLFVFEGNGEIKDVQGSLSDYASVLIDLEENTKTGTDGSNSSSGGTSSNDNLIVGGSKKEVFKEEKAKRNEHRNTIRQLQKDISNVEKKIDSLKIKRIALEQQVEQSNGKGWSVLADLTDQLNLIQTDIDDKELLWLELSEQLEEVQQ